MEIDTSSVARAERCKIVALSALLICPGNRSKSSKHTHSRPERGGSSRGTHLPFCVQGGLGRPNIPPGASLELIVLTLDIERGGVVQQVNEHSCGQNQVSDLTYIRLEREFMYLAIILDVF